MLNSDTTEEEIPSEIFVIQKNFFKNIFQEMKLKLGIFQSGQRRKQRHYIQRPNAKKKSIENGAEKIKKYAFDENENMPSTKILNEIKLERILDGLINICEVGLYELNGQQIESPQDKWQSVCHVIKEQQNDEIKIENQEKELKEKKLKFKQMRSDMENQRIQIEQRIEKQDETIASLRYNLQNMRRLNQLELKLVEKWEGNRYTQATIVTVNAESMLKQQIIQYQQLYQAEECRIREAEKFLALQMSDYRIRIAEWQEKFAKKLQKCEKNMQEQEEGIFDLRKTHETQREIYKERVKYVNEYLAEKAAEQELLMQEMRRIDCAVHIQAWWRGNMVRHGLGPFRKKTKKSKKSKK